jgi:hypothetical protein
MGNRFASGKWAIAQCDRCDQRFKLKVLRKEIIKTKNYDLLVRPDRSYYQSGLSGLQLTNTNSTAVDANGFPEQGSRVFQWGWNPVGGSSNFDVALTPNYLVATTFVGTVTVTVT